MPESEEERKNREAFQDKRWQAMKDQAQEKKMRLAEEIIRKAEEKRIAREAIKAASEARKAAAQTTGTGGGCIVPLIFLTELLISIIGPYRWS
jgi:aromatic ring-opening dioxygenase LigB subunit